MSDTDAAEEERWRVRKDKWFPPPIVHPDDLHLKQNQFVADGEIWTEVEDWRNILSF